MMIGDYTISAALQNDDKKTKYFDFKFITLDPTMVCGM
jgi:hypothetical protein